MWIVSQIYGRVIERRGETVLPVTGATVELDGGVQDPPATTNAGGFYMICSRAYDAYRTITVQKSGYRTATRRELYPSGDIDIELVRN